MILLGRLKIVRIPLVVAVNRSDSKLFVSFSKFIAWDFLRRNLVTVILWRMASGV